MSKLVSRYLFSALFFGLMLSFSVGCSGPKASIGESLSKGYSWPLGLPPPLVNSINGSATSQLSMHTCTDNTGTRIVTTCENNECAPAITAALCVCTGFGDNPNLQFPCSPQYLSGNKDCSEGALASYYRCSSRNTSGSCSTEGALVKKLEECPKQAYTYEDLRDMHVGGNNGHGCPSNTIPSQLASGQWTCVSDNNPTRGADDDHCPYGQPEMWVSNPSAPNGGYWICDARAPTQMCDCGTSPSGRDPQTGAPICQDFRDDAGNLSCPQ